jgi:hypothetical protein
MARISLKAIVLSGVLDLSLSFAIGIGVGIVFFVALGFAELPASEQTTAMMELMKTSTSYFAIAMVLGLGSSLLAGYVCASIAKRDWLLHGALSATVCSLFGLYGIITGAYPLHPVVGVLLLPLGPLLGTIGGYLRLRREAHLQTA